MRKRYLCVYFPRWSIDLVKRKLRKERVECDGPVALSVFRNGRVQIYSCCQQSSQKGLKRGMSVSFAREIIPELSVYEYDATRDFTLLKRLATKFLRYSPLVGIDADYRKAFLNGGLPYLSHQFAGIVIDLSGTDKLYDDGERLVEQIVQRLSHLGVASRVAIAPTQGAAWALSRYSRLSIRICQEKVNDEIRSFPVQALRITDQQRESLREMNISKVGELLKLSEKSLGGRFGVSLLKRVHQLQGVVHEVIEALHEQPQEYITQEFLYPLKDRGKLIKRTSLLFQKMLEKLEKQKLTSHTFLIRYEGMGETGKLAFSQKEVVFSSEKPSEKLLKQILPATIGGVRELREIVSCTLIAKDLRSPSSHQISVKKKLIGGGVSREGVFDRDEQEFSTFLDLLLSKISKSNLYYMHLKESFIPERACEFRSFSDRETREQAASFIEQHVLQRPPIVLPKPEELQAISVLPDNPPALLIAKGERIPIVQGFGPERVVEEWWRGSFATRDYFRVQDQRGQWLWIYRELSTQRWFLHGLWG